MKNEYLLLTIIPIIFIAGCVSQFQPTQETKPSETTSYSTTFGGLDLTLSVDAKIVKGVPFLVTGIVRNKGDQEASNIKVKLVRESGDLTSEGFDVVKTVAPDPLPPGEETTPILWNIQPNSTGLASIKGIISYHYRTVLEVDLDVFGHSYITSSGKAYEEYKSSPGIKRVKGSTSPVVMSISPLQKPLLVKGNEYPAVTFFITNPGNGVAKNLKLQVTSNPEGKISCDAKIDEKAINFGTRYPLVCNVKYGEEELKDGSKVLTARLVLEYDYENVRLPPVSLNVTTP